MGSAQQQLSDPSSVNPGTRLLAPVYRVTNPLEHAQALWPGLLHGSPQGSKSVWPTQHHKNPERLVDQLVYMRSKVSAQERMADLDASERYLLALDGLKDRYISLNTFNGRRAHANLRCLTGLVVDLDLSRNTSKYGTDFMAMRQDALDAVNAAGIPCPNLAVHTGRGVHLYWLFDRVVPAKAFPRWKACVNQLISLLSPIGADPAVRDTARVLRLVGTRNSKAVWIDPDTGEKHFWRVSAEVLRSQRHSFDFLADQILPVTRQDLEQQRKYRASRVVSIGAHLANKAPVARKAPPLSRAQRFTAIAMARQSDIDLLVTTLHPQGVPDGQRNTYLFHTACNLAWICNESSLLSEIKKWRDAHVPDMEDRELVATMGCALRRGHAAHKSQSCGMRMSTFDDERYVYSSDTLWKIFGSEIQRAGLQSQMQAILPVADRQERAKLKKKATRQARQITTYTGKGIRACNVPLALKAREMRASGLSLRDIAQVLAKAPKTVKAWLELPLHALGVAPPPSAAEPSPSPGPSKLSTTQGPTAGVT